MKFSHTIFAMPFAFVGFFMATKLNNYNFEWITLIYIVLCMIFARNAAMAFNRLIDKDIDKENPRTKDREIPSAQISPRKALFFTIINSILFITVAGLINNTVLLLSPIALAIIILYSYTKRFTFLAHLFLGIGLSIAPAGAYIAVTETLDLSIVIISAIVLLWTSGFDIIYSLQDEEFDKNNNLFSIPAQFGRTNALRISTIIHIICITLCIYWGVTIQGNFLTWIGISTFISLIIYQHIIVKPNDISRVNLAFGTTNGIASIVFATITIVSFYL